MVNISLAKLISVNKRSSNLVKGMLEGIRFLINQKDDKYRRTLEKKKKKELAKKKHSYDTSNHGSHEEFGVLQLSSRKASASAKPQQSSFILS